jgi:hypothetical protein
MLLCVHKNVWIADDLWKAGLKTFVRDAWELYSSHAHYFLTLCLDTPLAYQWSVEDYKL